MEAQGFCCKMLEMQCIMANNRSNFAEIRSQNVEKNPQPLIATIVFYKYEIL